MDNSSSSSSGLEEASMDDSEQEHEYDYDIDEAEDDAHDDYDDIPEEDEEEDDDDDMDDHVSHWPHELATTLSGVVSDFRLLQHRTEQLTHAGPFRATRAAANGFHFDNFVSVGGPLLLQNSREDSVRSLFEALEASSDSARILSSFEAIRVDAPNLLSSRAPRPNPLPVLASRLSRNADPPVVVHPHLAPPSRSTITNATSVELLSSLARRSPQLAPLIDRTAAVANVTNSSAYTCALDALHRVATLSSSAQSVSTTPPVLQNYVPSSVPRSHDGTPLHHLLRADLMRTVAIAPRAEDPLAALARARSSLERTPQRDTDRLRDVPAAVLRRWRYEPVLAGGDDLPSIVDPQASRRPSRSNLRSDPTHSTPNPDVPTSLVQSASKVSALIESMLISLGSIDDDLRAAEKRVEEEKKRREELREKEAERTEGQNDEDANASSASAVANNSVKPRMSDVDAEPVPQISSNSDSAVVEPGNATNAGNHGGVVMNSSEEANASEAPIGAHEINSQTPIQRDDDNDDGDSNSIIPVRGHEEWWDSVMETEETGEQASGEDSTGNPTAPEATEADATAPAITGSQFSAVATQRAAAAGISLEAPANENPEVVAAAMQSTGIDPAFLAALPEDMRTEILTEYYEQIRTNTGAQDGTSSSPPATSVNQDFLIALPPALRAEVLELEAEFQARQESRANAGADASGSSAPGDGAVAASEMDTATFLATLPPDLREEILLTSGEAVIQSLPPNVAAEARVLREREMSSRLPWRVGRNDGSNPFSSATNGRDYGTDRSGSSTGRRADRSTPREPPSYKWKKVSDGWLRERPNATNEPPASMKPDGLSALVGLLWARNASYGKNVLYQVLSHVCKSTELRYVILDELIRLITSRPDDVVASSSNGPAPEVGRSLFHGTAVRRGLELLTMLCKNDVLVSETLLGLPKSESELKHIGEKSIGEDEDENNRQIESNLSTLVSLIRNQLFTRSVSHLDQLVIVISVVAQAIPAQDVNSPEKTRSRRMPGRSRFFERHTLSQQIGDPMNMFYSVIDDDDHGMYDSRDDDVDEYRDIDEGFPSSGVRTRSGDSTRNAEENEQTEKKEKEKEVKEAVPVRFRVPALREADLVALTKVLLRSGCSERTYDRVSRTIGLLGELPNNRVVFMRALVSIATDSGVKIQEEYEKCLDQMRVSKQKLDSTFSLGSATNELTLLGVVKSLATLLKHNANQAKTKLEDEAQGVTEGKEVEEELEVRQAKALAGEPFRESVVQGLRDMWAALDQLLERVSDEEKVKEKKDWVAGSSRPSTIAAAAVLNGERLKAGSGGLSPTLARLSPMIEAFLVTHCSEEEESTKGEEGSMRSTPSTPTMSGVSTFPSRDELSGSEVVAEDKSLDERVAVFVERHRGAINALLRANSGLLERSFKGVLRHAHAIDFDNKKAYFRNVLRRRSSEAHAGTIRINVRRDRVFDDSYHQLRMRTPDEMKGRLHVQFNGEEGVDAGGVTREWYTILARQIFNPNYVLFTRSAAKAATYQPDKRSYINREHLENFRFVGRIIGKAIYDGQLLDAYFTRSFYKHILGLKPTYHDIEAQDPEYYNSLKWMLENNIDGILDYTMSAEYDEFGKQTIVDLMPNGRNVAVTEENKADYVRLVTEVRMTKTIEKQIEAFKEGFYELIPFEDCKIFNELELELLMSGLPDIDVADLKANVEYTGYTASSPQINWFWRCVSMMDQEDLARLVMFVTGTSKVPLEGFSQLQGMNGVQKFQIHRVGGATLRLPSAHTCFNQLDLPEYSSADILSERLLRAVRECSVGFGFA